MCIYTVLREVRKSYGIVVGNLNVRTRSACDTELNCTVNMESACGAYG